MRHIDSALLLGTIDAAFETLKKLSVTRGLVGESCPFHNKLFRRG
jgi:hypothetical protein